MNVERIEFKEIDLCLGMLFKSKFKRIYFAWLMQMSLCVPFQEYITLCKNLKFLCLLKLVVLNSPEQKMLKLCVTKQALVVTNNISLC